MGSSGMVSLSTWAGRVVSTMYTIPDIPFSIWYLCSTALKAIGHRFAYGRATADGTSVMRVNIEVGGLEWLAVLPGCKACCWVFCWVTWGLWRGSSTGGTVDGIGTVFGSLLFSEAWSLDWAWSLGRACLPDGACLLCGACLLGGMCRGGSILKM